MRQIWQYMLMISCVFSCYNGSFSALPNAAMEAAGEAVTITLTMLGAYMLWMGILEIGHESGLNGKLARGMSKLMAPLFPGVRHDGPAMEAISMNIAANTLGMGAAATPFGLKAMEHMARLQPGERASDDMIMFLVLNTSSLLLIPTSVIAVRAAAGSADAFSVTIPIILCSTLMTVVGIVTALFMRKRK
ncbi:MAG: nucleoside recognition protein [Clostridiales bacterium]|nr:nucleoside recognition protein [Clostridiales bacterium]